MNSPWDVVALRVGASMNSTPTPRAARSCTIPRTSIVDMPSRSGDLTHRCVVLPDQVALHLHDEARRASQCTYRCVVLPDPTLKGTTMFRLICLNAPTGAWCSLTGDVRQGRYTRPASQCTYRCVVLPDEELEAQGDYEIASQCTYRCVVLPDPCLREWRYDATSRARSATGPGSTPADRPAPGSD